MKNSSLIVVFALFLFFTSCTQIREVTEGLAGDITEYNTEYTFQTDRIVGSNYMEQIEDYMRAHDWLLTNDSSNALVFEQSTGVYEENTTARYESGNAEFYYDNDREIIELDLQLEGNYRYGTKENSLEIFNDLRDHLYE